MKFKTTLWVILYALMAGGSLAIFSTLTEFIKYIFSLLAIYIGIRFFRRFETIGLRISFVVLSIVMYFVVVIIIVIIRSLTDPNYLLGA